MIAISAFCSPASFSMDAAHYSWGGDYAALAWGDDLSYENWSGSYSEGYGFLPSLGDGESWRGD